MTATATPRHRVSLRAGVLATLAACCLSCQSQDPGGQAAAAAADLAFVGVTVVPMDSERLLADQTVLVQGDRISWLGPAAAVRLPETLPTINGTGKYLMPGLVDSHVHAHTEDHLRLYVANGITSVRNLWGGARHLEWKARLEDDSSFVSPSLTTAGPLIDGDPPIWSASAVARNAEEAQALVTAQADAGYNFIKIYNRLPAEAFEAIIATAGERGLSVEGHVPTAVGLSSALASGMRAVEHYRGYNIATLHDSLNAVLDGGYRPNRAELAQLWAAGELSFDQIFDPSKIERAVQETVEAGAWNTPTMTVLQFVAPDEYDERARGPGTEYLDPEVLASWRPNETADSDRRRALRALEREFSRRMTAALHAAGARLMVGTDTPNPFVIPGFSIHEELAFFVEAGLTPYETLERATRIPAEYAGTQREAGTIEAGKRADLILLDADPLEDVGHLKRLVGVMVRGQWISQREIEVMLADIADGLAS